MSQDLSGKRLELLKEAVPKLSRVALVVDLTDPFKQRTIKFNQDAAQALGISLWPAEISKPDHIEPVFTKIAQDRADGVVIPPGQGMMFNERARVGAAAVAHRLPALAIAAEAVPYGLLMAYGQNLPVFFRSAAAYTDRILKGAEPAEPTKINLVVNLKTAKILGLTMPQSLLLSADEVIE